MRKRVKVVYVIADDAGRKMAELQFEAPLAKFENEEWNDYDDFQRAIDIENSNKDCDKMKNGDSNENGETENFVETVSGSLEDLVNSFDEKITNCFRNLEENVDKLAPVQIRSQEEIMNDCQ